jgi:hypothetical protein
MDMWPRPSIGHGAEWELVVVEIPPFLTNVCRGSSVGRAYATDGRRIDKLVHCPANETRAKLNWRRTGIGAKVVATTEHSGDASLSLQETIHLLDREAIQAASWY